MDAGHHRFSVGTLDCIAVSDGALLWGPPDDPPPGTVLFANAPQAEVDAAVQEAGQALPWTQWTEECTCLVIESGTQTILVDAGAGDLDPGLGRLAENLAGAGVLPSDIAVVVISHCHPDHIGGLLTSDGAPAFPSARILLSKREWAFWMEGEAERVLAEDAGMLVAFARKTLPLVEDRVEFIDEEAELLPGVRCLATPGHTPGHLALELSSRGERLLVVADAILHPLHVEHPQWYSVVDADPILVTQTRRQLLTKAADEACLVHGFHFAFPGLGRIAAHGFAWRWASAF